MATPSPKTVSFSVLWPGGNTTALVEEHVERALQPEVATRIIHDIPDIEQVGFLEKATKKGAGVRLQMMGGEFCGNATRCAGFFWARKTGKKTLQIETSGLDELVNVDCSREGECAITMPRSFVKAIRAHLEDFRVDLDGISHIVSWADPGSVDIHKLLEPHRNVPAIGAIFVEQPGTAKAHIDPYVWVEGTRTLIHETGCASGSIAVAAALAHRDGEHPSYQIVQPTGEIYTVGFTAKTVSIGGKVEIRDSKVVHL